MLCAFFISWKSPCVSETNANKKTARREVQLFTAMKWIQKFSRLFHQNVYVESIAEKFAFSADYASSRSFSGFWIRNRGLNGVYFKEYMHNVHAYCVKKKKTLKINKSITYFIQVFMHFSNEVEIQSVFRRAEMNCEHSLFWGALQQGILHLFMVIEARK